jgi:hypothetical protein
VSLLNIEYADITPDPLSNSSPESRELELYDFVGDAFLPPLVVDAYELGLIGAGYRSISLLAETLR